MKGKKEDEKGRKDLIFRRKRKCGTSEQRKRKHPFHSKTREILNSYSKAQGCLEGKNRGKRRFKRNERRRENSQSDHTTLAASMADCFIVADCAAEVALLRFAELFWRCLITAGLVLAFLAAMAIVFALFTFCCWKPRKG